MKGIPDNTYYSSTSHKNIGWKKLILGLKHAEEN